MESPCGRKEIAKRKKEKIVKVSWDKEEKTFDRKPRNNFCFCFMCSKRDWNCDNMEIAKEFNSNMHQPHNSEIIDCELNKLSRKQVCSMCDVCEEIKRRGWVHVGFIDGSPAILCDENFLFSNHHRPFNYKFVCDVHNRGASDAGFHFHSNPLSSSIPIFYILTRCQRLEKENARHMNAKWSLNCAVNEIESTLCLSRVCYAINVSISLAPRFGLRLNMLWGQQTNKSRKVLHSIIDKTLTREWNGNYENLRANICDSNLMDIYVYCLPFMFLFANVYVVVVVSAIHFCDHYGKLKSGSGQSALGSHIKI